jgi:hypothetical protein
MSPNKLGGSGLNLIAFTFSIPENLEKFVADKPSLITSAAACCGGTVNLFEDALHHRSCRPIKLAARQRPSIAVKIRIFNELTVLGWHPRPAAALCAFPTPKRYSRPERADDCSASNPSPGH